MLPGGGVIVGHHGKPAGHGLQGDVAVGLGEAGKEKHGVVGGEIFPRAHPGEHRLGMPRLQPGALGTVAHQHQLHAGIGRPHALPGLHHPGQVLLGSETPHVQGHGIVLRHAPGATQLGTAAGGGEEGRVHPPGHHDEVTVTMGLELPQQTLRGHHGAQGFVMELAQVRRHRGAQEAQAVMAGIGVEIGVEVRRHGDAQLQGGVEGGPAQRALGRHVHEVGPLHLPQPRQGGLGGQPHLQALVARDGHPGLEHLLETRGPVRLVGGALARADELDVVLAGVHGAHHALQGHGHAVDLGRVGLGNHRQSQGTMLGGQVLENEGVHGGPRAVWRYPTQGSRRYGDGKVMLW